MSTDRPTRTGAGPARAAARWLLGTFLIGAGTAHLIAPDAFLGQVPDRLPAPRAVILVSGVAEIGVGASLVLARRHRRLAGWVTTGLLVAVFPGNIHQAIAGTDAFGLTTPVARWARLAAQPLLVLWALWATGIWPPTTSRRHRVRSRPPRG